MMNTRLKVARKAVFMGIIALSVGLLVPIGPSAFAQAASFSGNVSTKIYHNSGCRYFNCKKCTAIFSSAQEAVNKGYKACKVCHG